MKTMSRSEAKTARDRSFVVVENVNHPGKTRRADTARYEAMKRAVLKVLPRRSPGLDYARMTKAVLPHLPKTVFPGGARAGWWLKTVQLDLEAKGLIERESTQPLTWRRS